MSEPRTPTGVPGLDEILHGGFITRFMYLVAGGIGTGKTTMGLQFLHHGAQQGEPVLFVSFEQPEAVTRRAFSELPFDLSDISFLDLTPPAEDFAFDENVYSVLTPDQVVGMDIVRRLSAELERQQPRRVFVDGINQLRAMAPTTFHFRQNVLSLSSYITGRDMTVLVSAEETGEEILSVLRFATSGVIRLGPPLPARTLRVDKMAGSGFMEGSHTMKLNEAGMRVFPRLVPAEYSESFEPAVVPFGIPGLDQMLHGGVERGTITLLSGPSGTGKTALSTQLLGTAARAGERCVMYSFSEAPGKIVHRAKALGAFDDALLQTGRVDVVGIEPLLYTTDEFALRVRDDVKERGVRIIAIDDISGYSLSVQGEDLVGRLRALSTYLQSLDVTLLLVNEIERMTGDFSVTEKGFSYLVDNVIFTRFIELDGELRKAVGILKKRESDFDKGIHEFTISGNGLEIGPPLRGFRGILSGVPEPLSTTAALGTEGKATEWPR